MILHKETETSGVHAIAKPEKESLNEQNMFEDKDGNKWCSCNSKTFT